jgi:hypothetical protein
MPSQAESLFSPPCPYCRGVGAAHEVLMQAEQRTITYTCGTCLKNWKATARVPYESSRGEQPSQREVARS